MNESTIRDLLKLYEEGKATEEQRQLVETYLAWHQQQSPKRGLNRQEREDPLQEIMEKIRLAREQEARTEAGPEKNVPVEVPEEAPVYPMEGTGRLRRRVWIAAASIALIMTGGLFLWKQSSHQPAPEPLAITYKTVRADPGKMIHLRLSDSSEVWLNAGAILRYPQPFDDKMRKLELLDGEAFFQVHPDASRGFEVQTDHLLTKVLGTSFNIKSYRESQQMSVSVTSGKVAVIPGTTIQGQPISDQGQGLTLTSNQEARYNTATGRLIRSVVASDRIRDWQNGTFNFVEESLGDIAIELEHFFNVHIGFKYPGMKKYTISASFPHTMAVKDMLATLCLLNQNHFIQIDAQHYVIR